MRRLDVALIARNPGLSRRKAQDAIAKGQVSVSGSTVDEPGAMVADDAAVTWDVNRKAAVKRRVSLPVLYRDEHLLVVDKPAGLLSVPTDPDAVNEDSVLRRLLRDLGNPGRRPPFVGAVHRIDRGTSGALVFALDAPTRTGLRSLFRAHRIVRHYGAIVVGRTGRPVGRRQQADPRCLHLRAPRRGRATVRLRATRSLNGAWSRTWAPPACWT